MIAAPVFVVALLAAPQPPPCVGAATSPALDHVIIVVKDLDAAGAAFERHGFRIKPGRLHPNGLLNKHMKFRDGTEIELMTVKGRPGDSMARGYAELLAAGEGGVYLALKARSPAELRRAAAAARLTTRERRYGAWTFVSFASGSPASAVFFTSGDATVNDPPEIFTHRPDTSGLSEVWLEAGDELGAMLVRLGAKDCGSVTAGGVSGRRFGVRGGAIVIVRKPARRGRVLGVILAGDAAAEIRPHPAFWIRRR